MIKKGIYRHYKGGEYEVLGEAVHSETLQKMVIYKALYKSPDFPVGTWWVRPADMFSEWIEIGGKSLPRFEWIRES
ncbi:MAG: hypothetical protein Fur0041_20820 [Bacteroidia bacterium]